MKIRIELTEDDLKKLIIKELENSLGNIALSEDKVKIYVKSKQNFKPEWESADFKAIYETI